MPAPRLLVAAVASLLVGLGAGFLVAHRLYAPPPPRAQIAPTQSGLAGEVQAALTLQDRVRGVNELSAILMRARPEDLEQVRAGFESVFLDVAEIEIVLFAEWWAAFDPEAVFRWTQSSRVANHTMVIRSAVRAWARRDPLAARDAVGKLLDPITRRACLDALVSGWDDSGQGGLIEFLYEMPPSVEQLRALAAIARRKVLRDGPDAAFRWVESLPDDKEYDVNRFKLQLFRRVASAAASVDLPRAADWTLQHYQGRYGDGLLGRIGNTWAMRDGPGAMAWLAALPESPRRERGVEDTYRAWLDWDNVGALDWMKQREAQPEPWLEPAFALYVVSVSPQDPEHALALSQKILDGDRRDGVVVTIARMWRASAPDAADAWLARAELSPAVRAMILQAQGPQDIPAGDSAQLPDAP